MATVVVVPEIRGDLLSLREVFDVVMTPTSLAADMSW
jgi:hypothetical protein